MQEKNVKTVKKVGGGNIAIGVVFIIVGLVCGILAIVNGGRLLKMKPEHLF